MSESATVHSPIAHGTLLDKTDEQIILGLPQTDYRFHLKIDQPVDAVVGKRISGTIHANARRVDLCRSGGRLVEPVYGRPRRVQGKVIGADPDADAITVLAACPFVCKLMPSQSPGDFPLGAMVTFDVEPGARFVPEK